MTETTVTLVYCAKCDVERPCVNGYVWSLSIRGEGWTKCICMCHVVNISEDN